MRRHLQYEKSEVDRRLAVAAAKYNGLFARKLKLQSDIHKVDGLLAHAVQLRNLSEFGISFPLFEPPLYGEDAEIVDLTL